MLWTAMKFAFLLLACQEHVFELGSGDLGGLRSHGHWRAALCVWRFECYQYRSAHVDTGLPQSQGANA
eukprot:11313752-Alexandrium_andersonii.AAC.1